VIQKATSVTVKPDLLPGRMIVRFLEISSEDRRIIAKAIFKHLESDKETVDPKKVQNLQTSVMDENENESEAA